MPDDFVASCRLQASAWKARTPTLPEAARAAAPYIDKSGVPGSVALDFCLPPVHAHLNLLPDACATALTLFGELGIPWHAGVGVGPSNHLLSSQVMCANALAQMVREPERIKLAFGSFVDINEVLQIEPGRFLTFEYVGPADYFGEAVGGSRIRGAYSTSVDAAFRYRTSTGQTEVALVEWKYTESYRRKSSTESATNKRRLRYHDAWSDSNGPLRQERLHFELLLHEPFYQLMRQQLLAHRMEQEAAEGADVVRVLHVLPPENLAYQKSLACPEHREVGDTVDAVWTSLLRRPDRFVHVDPIVFCDPAVTSDEYVDRYRLPAPLASSQDAALDARFRYDDDANTYLVSDSPDAAVWIVRIVSKDGVATRVDRDDPPPIFEGLGWRRPAAAWFVEGACHVEIDTRAGVSTRGGPSCHHQE